NELVSAAKTRGDRIRAESDRELSAASQRRDSINAQLTNVRQMLATLSGTAPVNPLGDEQPEKAQPAQPAQAPQGKPAEGKPTEGKPVEGKPADKGQADKPAAPGATKQAEPASASKK
ncbi:MAG TPA: hypothetical protein VFD41_05925, partial [Actinomycetales bacterium]|nr:hypothetical protein [Actinomycetales bacterium]